MEIPGDWYIPLPVFRGSGLIYSPKGDKWRCKHHLFALKQKPLYRNCCFGRSVKRKEELQNEMNFTTFERVSEEILQIEEGESQALFHEFRCADRFKSYYQGEEISSFLTFFFFFTEAYNWTNTTRLTTFFYRVLTHAVSEIIQNKNKDSYLPKPISSNQIGLTAQNLPLARRGTIPYLSSQWY